MKINSSKASLNILTGFFGSGKTTLIRKIINTNYVKSSQIAIIQNEFSDEMGIEKGIIEDGEGRNLGNFIEMPSGCMCCVVKDSLVLFLKKLLEKKQSIAYIIIECHGMSDIQQLINKFWIDKELDYNIQLNSIINVLDCSLFNKNLKIHKKVLIDQIICSDKILLNKIDKVDTDTIDKLTNVIKDMNPLATIYKTVYTDINITDFFNEGDFIKIKNDFPIILNNDQHYIEEHKIQNLIIHLNKEISREIIDKKLGLLIWEESINKNIEIIRYKGIFYTHDVSNKLVYHYMIQGIYDLYEINEIKREDYDNQKKYDSKILFIGLNILDNSNFLKNWFNK